MLITRECDYAVRAVRALADHEKKTVKQICEAEHIPLPYAYKILKKLEKAGIVQGTRGASGGYVLCKNLESFSLLDIALAIETDMHLNDCLTNGFDCPHNIENHNCIFHLEFRRIQKILQQALSEKTMKELLK